ncbi:MAG TPA: CHAT domain-containing protein [bacterium]|nr:CHAT domain-containing protein [bacterium]HND76057.1 CHAT domain-containing protein [bacterium]HNF85064.1 CHAT domain-containing protein [bacterium]HNI11048.1 CHAT domain-containing protein [bacterium]HNM13367.1 CHAT domain-containing protein [bacterium]
MSQINAQDHILLDSVDALLRESKYADAIHLFEVNSISTIHKPATHAALSKAYFYLGQNKESQSLYSSLLLRKDVATMDRFRWTQDYILVAAETGNFKLCDSLLTIIQSILPTVKDSTALARYWNTVGIIYIQSSQPFLANEALNKAEHYMHRDLDLKLQSWIVSNRGIVYKMMGDFASAIEKYRMALYQDSLRNDKADMAADYQNLSLIFSEMQLYADSRYCFEKALEYIRMTGDVGTEGIILNNMAHLFNNHGQIKSALQCLRSSLVITEKAGDKIATADAYYELAGAFRALSQYDSAIYFWNKAYDIYCEIGSIDQTFFTLLEKFRAMVLLKQFKQGDQLLEQAFNLLSQLPSKRYSPSYYDARALYFESINQTDSADAYYVLALQSIDSIYQEQNSAHVYDASIPNDRTRFYKNYIRFLFDQKKYHEALSYQLLLNSRSTHNTKPHPILFFESGVSFFQADTVMHVLLNTERELQYRRLCITPLIKDHLLQIKTLLRQPSANQHSLSQHLAVLSDWINPAIIDYVQSHKELVIVPDGLLCNFPFEMLSLERRYLTETHTIQYTAALNSDEKFSIYSERTIPSVTILARSEYSSWTSLPDLPDVDNEIDRIKSIIPHSQIYYQVTEKSYYDIIGTDSSQVLHLIGHGMNATDDARKSGIILGRDQIHHDGYLTCNEIEKQQLRGQSVILSACETSVNTKISQKNIPAIPEAFLNSGASLVLSTLWKINDRDAVNFVDQLYQHWVIEKSIPAALQKTKRDFIVQNTLPFYWASWVIWK